MSLLAVPPHPNGEKRYCPGGWYSVGDGNVGMVGHSRLVVVSVTVVTEVLIVVVVDGAGASVVVVTGAAVVVVVVAVGGGATVVVGVGDTDSVTVWVVGAGAGAADWVVLGADDEVAGGVVVGVEVSDPTNFTTA